MMRLLLFGLMLQTVALCAGDIVFQSRRDGARELYQIDTQTRQITRLTRHLSHDAYPVWSPDGQWLAFCSERKGPWAIWVSKGGVIGQEKQLLKPRSWDAYPVWTPDSKALVFASKRRKSVDIYRIDIESRALKQLTDHEADETQPSVSPDGRWLAFVSNRRGPLHIFIQDLQTGNLTDLGPGQWPKWHPVGRRLVCVDLYQNRKDLFLIEADTGKRQRLTISFGDKNWPNWSPDGKQLVFASEQKGNWDIYTYHMEEKMVTHLTKHPGMDITPSWRPAKSDGF
jgi:TolB protein